MFPLAVRLPKVQNASGNKPCILIAEDDNTSRLILEAAVGQLGHEVISARDGEEAWRLFQAAKVDAVISDRSMPGIDGLELCRRIRESPDGRYVYFIFLTSLNAETAAADGMVTGADDYLAKPFNAHELSTRLLVASRITALYRDLRAQKTELQALNIKLFEQTRLDGLTQLGNRVKLRDELDRIARRVAEHDEVFCAVMCDVDHFKRYNDTYGHLRGDDVLRAVARTLTEMSRPDDQVFRYGGEEFLIILPGERIEGGFACAERHRSAVEGLAIPHGESPQKVVTISAGVAPYVAGCRGGLKGWLERADAALYRAKQMSRNLVVAADGAMPQPAAESGGQVPDASDGSKGSVEGGPSLGSLLAADYLGAMGEGLSRVLQVVRAHLGMDVAFISEFEGERRIFRHVDARGGRAPIRVGDSYPLKDGYCLRVVDGRLPQLIPDTSEVSEAMGLPATKTLPIGAHLSVPIRLRDGSVYGTFCAFSHSPNASLNERDLNMMRAFADLAAYQIQRGLDADESRNEKVRAIRKAIEERQFAIAYQPIHTSGSKQVVGFECLARFSGLPPRAPDVWFSEAAEVGLGAQLELAAIRAALESSASFPDGLYLALNASFDTIVSPEFADAIGSAAVSRLVLEITEHDSISDYEQLSHVLAPFRQKGLRVAVDDAGAGYASFRHILRIKPDLIKLDRSLIQQIDADPGRRALATALVGFARETGSKVVAEGVEASSEFVAVRLLGVDQVQGFLLGKPMPLAQAVELVRRSHAA